MVVAAGSRNIRIAAAAETSYYIVITSINQTWLYMFINLLYQLWWWYYIELAMFMYTRTTIEVFFYHDYYCRCLLRDTYVCVRFARYPLTGAPFFIDITTRLRVKLVTRYDVIIIILYDENYRFIITIIVIM